MDIEELNKSQIVLLTLLVSFVTSIATGIVTVSLMQQAPPAITQTVNRVIEHTVEKVVPGQTAVVAAPSLPAQTVVVKQTDSIATAVTTASPAIARIYGTDADAPFLGLGVVLDSSGVLAIDASSIGDKADAVVEYAGARVRAFVVKRDDATGIAYLHAATSTPDGKPAPAWKPVSYTSAHPVLGNTVLALSGKSSVRLGQGIITASQPLPGSEGAGGILETNIPEGSIMAGSMLIDTDGALIGMSTAVSRSVGAGDFVSADQIGVKDTEGGQQ